MRRKRPYTEPDRIKERIMAAKELNSPALTLIENPTNDGIFTLLVVVIAAIATGFAIIKVIA